MMDHWNRIDALMKADIAKIEATKIHRAEWSLLKRLSKCHQNSEQSMSAEIISRRSAALSTLFAMNSLAFAAACETHAVALKDNDGLKLLEPVEVKEEFDTDAYMAMITATVLNKLPPYTTVQSPARMNQRRNKPVSGTWRAEANLETIEGEK